MLAQDHLQLAQGLAAGNIAKLIVAINQRMMSTFALVTIGKQAMRRKPY